MAITRPHQAFYSECRSVYGFIYKEAQKTITLYNASKGKLYLPLLTKSNDRCDTTTLADDAGYYDI
jgi:hypothetical protein